MNVIDLNKVEIAKTPHKVDVKRLFDKDFAQVVHIHLKPGEALKKHITYTDVVFYVIEGKGVVEIGDEKKEVSKDMLIESPREIPHCWYNESNDDLRILVVKTPKPTNNSKLL